MPGLLGAVGRDLSGGRNPARSHDVDRDMDQRIVVKGELDLAAAPTLLRRLDDALEADPGGSLEVDFGGVTFIDSSGLGVLVACRKRAVLAGGELTVTNVAPRIRQVFEITGLDKVLFRPCQV